MSSLQVPEYAAYAIVVSLGPWWNLLNVGVPSTAQNEIAELRAVGQDVQPLRETVLNAALWAALVGTVLSWPLGAALHHTLLSAHASVSLTGVALLCCGLCINAMSMVANQVLFGLHRAWLPNVVPGVQALGASAVLWLLHRTGGMSFEGAAISFVLPAALSFLLSIAAAKSTTRLHMDVALLRSLLRRSLPFLLLAALAAATLSVDYVIMARILPAVEVVEYSLAGKVFAVLLSVHAVVLTTAWTPLSDAHFTGDRALLRRRVRQLLMLGGLLVLLPSGLLLVFKQPVFELITGSAEVQVRDSLLLAWVGYVVLRVWCDTFAVAHMSAKRTRLLNAYIPFQAVFSIFGQWVLGQRLGALGVMLGLCGSFLLTAAWVLPLRFYQQTKPQISLP
ncbi:hypothetical protein [Aquabacterium sp. J223]|uniref:hypothetical protein n=1 Tax=Aquabacterium sp. J223 TaxID=2898431 RepID=UPI0021AD864C|nr:hypothetical protein [Aquabacterium sp. J223]UUX96773.1 hypothetical protein LRS07_05680 [Aquabacterium sp. J223]